MGHEGLKRKMDESFEWDIRYYSECVENLLTKQEQVSRIIDSLNGDLDSLQNFWHHVTCGTSFLTIRMETVKESRRIVNALLQSDLIEDFKKDFDSQSNLEPGKRRPEWKWVSRIKGEWHFNIFVYPALPNPLCKPKKIITRKKAEKEKAWVCQVNN